MLLVVQRSDDLFDLFEVGILGLIGGNVPGHEEVVPAGMLAMA